MEITPPFGYSEIVPLQKDRKVRLPPGRDSRVLPQGQRRADLVLRVRLRLPRLSARVRVDRLGAQL